MNRTMFIVLGLLPLAACSYTRPLTIAPMSLGPKEHPVAVAKGQAGTDYFLGFNVGGDNTFAAAIENARIKAGAGPATTMANVFADQEIFCLPACFFPIFKSIKTTVLGTLVTYDLTPTKTEAHADGGAM